jgi:membrane-associated phospholipid phosphatase
VDSRRRSSWLRAWGVIVASFAVNQLVKLLFRRPRPDFDELPRLTGTMSNRSYPSAHATTSAAAVRVLPPLLAPLAPQPLRDAVAPTVASAAVAMALSRLYLGVHWASDTLAGLALGWAVAELAS